MSRFVCCVWKNVREFSHDAISPRTNSRLGTYQRNSPLFITARLVVVGLHKRQVGSMVQARNSGLRTAAGRTAPADGLYLEQVLYD